MNLIRSLAALLILALIVLVVCCILCVRTLQSVAAELPVRLERQVQTQVSGALGIVDRQVSTSRDQVLGLLDRRAGDIRQDLARGLAAVDGRVGSIQIDLDRQLTAANTSISRVASTAERLNPILSDGAAIAARLRVVADQNLECRGNGSCWPAGITAGLGGAKVLLGESALTMRTFRKATPEFLDIGRDFGRSSVSTAANVERITRPDSWPVKALKIAAPIAGGAILGFLK